jgi:hypothetical protein
VADPLQTPPRGTWLHAVARWMKTWAESVLAEEATRAPASSPPAGQDAAWGGGPVPSAKTASGASVSTSTGSRAAGGQAASPTDVRTEATPSGPRAALESLEERWLRDVEARRSLPLSDWQARVKKAAPPVEGRAPPRMGRMAPATPADAPAPVRTRLPPAPLEPVGDARPLTRASAPSGLPTQARERAVGTPPLTLQELLATQSREFVAGTPPLTPQDLLATQPRERLAGTPPLTLQDLLAPEVRPAPSPVHGRTPYTRQEPPPLRWPDPWERAPEPAPAFRAPPSRPGPRRSASSDVSTDTRAEAPRSPWSDLPPFTDTAAPRPPAPPLRVLPSPPRDGSEPSAPERTQASSSQPRFRLLFLDGDPISAQEPRRNRAVLSPEEDTAWDAALAPRGLKARELPPAPAPRHPFPSLDGPSRATGEALPTAAAASPWPELPPAPTPDNLEAVVELRQWERRRRLDREQRGE